MRPYLHLLRNVLILISFFTFSHPVSAAELLKGQNEALFRELQRVHGLSDSQMDAIRAVFSKSGYIGQGNQAITRHPATLRE
ncbi:MAG: hypothetical protein ABII26_10075 [Pseudomonadota bacterium]